MHFVLVPLTAKRNQKNPDAPAEYYVMKSYIKKLAAYGLAPLFVTQEMPMEAVEELYKNSHGMLVMGGPDIDPSLYGEVPHPKTLPSDSATDAFVCKLVQRSVEDHKPFLGICRGAQALNVACGGTLYQHLPDVTDMVHKDEAVKDYTDITKAPKHDIIFTEGSKARGLFGVATVRVNSVHHQAVKDVGEGLLVSAQSPDGIIEMIEHKDPAYFCFGIQSHPEAEGESFGDVLFKEFAGEIKNFTSNLVSYAHNRN